MAVYPLIESPCPYKGKLSEILDGDICRLCHREVHDLTGMSGADRRAFLKSCRGEVCVSYSVAAVTAASLGLLAASAIAAPSASAQTTDPTEQIHFVIVGGLKNGSEAALVVHGEDDDDVPELPVVYEPAPQDKTPSAIPAIKAKPEDEQTGK